MPDGFFITFEGGDGVGKSTQISLLAKALGRQGFKVLVTREPGGTRVGEKLRKILKTTSMLPRAELLIFEASRAELVETLIRPHLVKGWIVLSDRYQESSLVYQGMVRGLPLAVVHKANQIATDGLQPHLIVLLDSRDPQVASKRRSQRLRKDRFEREKASFHRKIEAGFRRLARENHRIRIYDSTEPRQNLHKMILRDVEKLIDA